MKRRLLCGLLLALFAPALIRADYLVVKRSTAIRAEPSRTAEALSHAQPESVLQLVGDGRFRNGYYPVTDPETGQAGWIYRTFVRRYTGEPPTPSVAAPSVPPSPPGAVDCAAKIPLRVHFYDVGQALSALVDLPDGRHVLVDAGDAAVRAGCGTVCRDKHDHLVEKLRQDLGGRSISMLWITHQHSDHVGGAADLLGKFSVELYVDNGQDLGKTQVKKTHETAIAKGVRLAAVDPEHTSSPIADSGPLKIRPVVPDHWPVACEDDPNNCSIGLRIDYCSSSVLFTGDAEDVEEEGLDPAPATLLQVGHHGSDTSTSATFLKKVSPKYAVISAGKRDEGLNKTYCHPRQVTVTALTTSLGGPGRQSIQAFDGTASCRRETDADWKQVRANDHLWSTSRDGDVTLVTKGDGTFARK